MPSLDLVIPRVLHHYLKRWYKIAMSEGVSSVLQTKIKTTHAKPNETV